MNDEDGPVGSDVFGDEGSARVVEQALHGADDGELYIESSVSESFSFDDGRLKSAAYDTDCGFGLRVVADEATGYAHSNQMETGALRRAADTAAQARKGYSGVLSVHAPATNRRLYAQVDPTEVPRFSDKTDLLAQIDAWCRAQDSRIVQVSVGLSGSVSRVDIVRPDSRASEIRPLVRLDISVTMEAAGRRETGSAGAGGRARYDQWIDHRSWQALARRAMHKAEVNLGSEPAPAGEMPVVLGPGWPAVLLHEAVGHGLEGDFIRKQTSVYAGRQGEMVASAGVTVIDDGTIEGRRGSLSFDDEGVATTRTVLIEDGRLVNFMQDRLNARKMGTHSSGNGRRESYAHMPMPRMTNTFMLGGGHEPEEMVASVKRGIWAVDFGGGQVDITNGQFVFQCTEAYLIEDGKKGPPVRNATLIGHGPTVLSKVSMIGNDFALDDGVGTCGKAGQMVPVGVGQPSVKVDALTVGGSA